MLYNKLLQKIVKLIIITSEENPIYMHFVNQLNMTFNKSQYYQHKRENRRLTSTENKNEIRCKN